MPYHITHIINKCCTMSNNSKQKNSVYMMMALLLITKVLGFLKLRIIAQLFGATHELDIFWAAFTIPDTLFMIIVAGSLNAAIIPLLASVLHKEGERKLNEFFTNLMIVISSIIVFIAVLLFIFAPQLTSFLIRSDVSQSILNFSSRITQEDFKLFVDLTRIMMISPVLLGISTIVTGYLQTRREFFITSLAPLMYNLAMVVGPIIFVVGFKMGVKGVAICAVLGSFLHFAVQIPTLRKYFKEKVKLTKKSIVSAVKDSAIWKGLKLAVPKMISTIGEQINIVVNTLISFSLAAGALSSYKFALSLYLFPVNIVGGAFAQSVLPELSSKADKQKEFKDVFNKTIQLALFLVLPIVSILLVLRLPIVRLTFGVGEFDWRATVLTSWCLVFLSLAILSQTLSQILLRAFYALKETWKPLLAVGVGIVVNIVFAFLLTNFFSHYYDWRPILQQVLEQIATANGSGVVEVIKSFFADIFTWCTTRGTSDMAVGGLSMSLSLASFVELILLFCLLNKEVKIITYKDTVKPMLKKVLNGILMAVGMYLVFKLFDFKLDTTRTISIIILTIVTSLYGLLSYWLGSKVFEIKEVGRFEEKVKSIWKKLKEKVKVWVK